MSYILIPVGVLLSITALLLIAIHLGFRAPRNRERGTPGDFGFDYRQVTIPTLGNRQLFGWLLPVASSNTTLIILHGWGGNAELMMPLAIPFRRAGLNVLLFDARNHGSSDGHSFSSMPKFAEDLGMVIDWLKREHGGIAEKVVLLGHSVGAGAVLLAASRRADIAAAISVSAFAHPEWMMRRYLKRLPKPLVAGILYYVQWVIGHRFAQIAPLETVCHVTCPVLLVHGTADSTVPVEDSRAIIGNCDMPHLTLLEIEGAGHDSVDKVEQHANELLQFLRAAGVCSTANPSP
jgi:pimeloyl-ACP methyl ester carboxylesterase